MNGAILVLAALLTASTAVHAAGVGRRVDWNFTGGADGDAPRGDLLATKDGTLFGVTNAGGTSDNGVVYRIKPYGPGNHGETVIWNFTGAGDGSTPMAGVIADASGAVYGTTARDGAGRAGTVYRLSPPAAGQTAWTETTLWSFSGAGDGGQPVAALAADRSGSGVLYGTTSFGGAHGMGVVFALTPPAAGKPAWTETVLWSFSGGADGASPAAALLQAASGALYGTASKGGAANAGTVFELTPPVAGSKTWSLAPIWIFSGGPDGATPAASLIADASGNLYGTTQFGGANFCPEANWPYYGEPNSDSNYALSAAYVTPGGNSCGVAFALSPPAMAGEAWSQTILFTFAGDQVGCNPSSGLLLAQDGALYGTAPINDEVYPKRVPPLNLWTGDLYKLTPPAAGATGYTASVVSSFVYKSYGFNTSGGVVAGPAHALWGATVFGGNTWTHLENFGYGTVYFVVP